MQALNYVQQNAGTYLDSKDATPERIKEHAEELLSLGFKTLAVARRVGVQPKLLRAILNDEVWSSAIERRVKVSALIAEGRTTEYMAAHLGVGASIIRDDLKVLRVKPSQVSGRARRMRERKEGILLLHEEGRSIDEIAQSLEITTGQVKYVMRALGLPCGFRGRPRAS